MIKEECKECDGRGWVGPESQYGVGFRGPNTCTNCGGRGYIIVEEKKELK